MFDEDYATALSDLASVFPAFRAPQATRVSVSAQRSLMIKQPGGPATLWSPDETPYMVEPMDKLSSRLHEAVIFAGPARTGKTEALLKGFLAHAVISDPGDMLFIQMTQDKAREFSKVDISRAIDNSPDIAAMLSASAADRNTHDIMFRHGMWLRIAWPTVSNVSGSTYRYGAITDYDRIGNAENVDGEGSLFGLVLKRIQTFLSRGMALAESSPGKEITDPTWRPATPHEAPPVGGILGLYNLTDRNRWYWRCPDCSSRFEAKPGIELFNMPDDTQLIEEVRTANLESMAAHYGTHVVCPHCGSMIERKAKRHLNKTGIWVPDNCIVNDDDEIEGPINQSKMAGYWLGGVAAAYQNWESLVLNHLRGLRDYALTGSEETLKRTINTDQGMPYTPRHLLEDKRNAKTVEEKAEDYARYVAPDWTRCLLAQVDVQGGSTARFVVQIHAVGPHLESQVIDRFDIKDSKREGMGTEFAPIDPMRYPEDWDVLTDKILEATWKTHLQNREIKVRRLVVDTGGEGDKDDGSVTANAYAWFRRIRQLGHGDRVRLYKGASEKKAPLMRLTRVGKKGLKDKGDVPLLLCNPHLLSDAVDAGIRRETPGPNYIHFPKPRHPTLNPNGWVTQAFFDELKAEIRGPTGVWSKIKRRNETFDLCRMARANMLSLGLDKVRDWNSVPDWLAPLELNSFVIETEERREMKSNETVSAPDEVLEVEKPTVRVIPTPGKRKKVRRSVASPYLG